MNAEYDAEHAPDECTICEPIGCICACHGDATDHPNGGA